MTLTTEQLAALKEVAERARRKRPGSWAVHDSCSWRRIGTVEPYGDGDVICPTTQRSDNHPDLLAEREVLDHIAAFDPTTCLELLEEVERLRECHATKGAHTIDCALAQKEAGTGGKKK